MCEPTASKHDSGHEDGKNDRSDVVSQSANESAEVRQRRGKRDKEPLSTVPRRASAAEPPISFRKKKESRAYSKHKDDTPSGGIEALIPSLIGVTVLVVAIMAKMGFRGRASVAGIDLGTTNSVICIQAQAGADIVIDCIPDPSTGSPVVPSVVSFLEASERKVGPSSKIASQLSPHPSHVVVGSMAKKRIDSHPHHTLYNAKRVLGRSLDDPAIDLLADEVEFRVLKNTTIDGIEFHVPDTTLPILPHQVGSYVVHHLKRMAVEFLGHENVQSAVICVPAKFTPLQRQETARAFQQAGMNVVRIVEEPTAAALAYGLHRKPNVDHILVYDFGGGTLDISLLHVSEGFVDVMGSDGDDRLGGTDFDVAIAHFLQEEKGGSEIQQRVSHALNELEASLPKEADLEDLLSAKCPAILDTPLCTVSSFHTIGEQLKIRLSESHTTDDKEISVSEQCLGLMGGSDELEQQWTFSSFCEALRPVTLTLTSTEYDIVAQPLFDRSIIPVHRLLDDLDLKPADLDEIVLVGGTTRMPHIRELVRNAFSESQLNMEIDPDITVAYGAASVID